MWMSVLESKGVGVGKIGNHKVLKFYWECKERRW